MGLFRGTLLQVLYKTALGMSNGLFCLSILSSRYDQRGNHRDPVLFQQDIRLIWLASGSLSGPCGKTEKAARGRAALCCRNH